MPKLHTVHVRINDAATGQPTPCRVRFTDAEETYRAPFGRQTEFACLEDIGGNVRINGKAYAYIDGTCEIRLPAGPIRIEVSKGPEYQPLNQEINLKPGQLAIRLTIERWINLREQSWYSGDCGIAEITPHGALLEAAAEDLAVANLVVKTRRRRADAGGGATYQSIDPNLLAFSGQEPALQRPGHMVVVNTTNRIGNGFVQLLNCHRPVYPLDVDESDAVSEWTLADLCDQCHRKGGLAVALGCDPRTEELADFILGKVDVLMMGSFENPHHLYPVLDEWYDLLQSGFRVPLVNRGDKYDNETVVGRNRTYGKLLPGQEFNYKNWIEAVRSGRIFVTSGPLLSLKVNGDEPGAIIDLAAETPWVRIHAFARSLERFEKLEVVVNREVLASADATGTPWAAAVDAEVQMPRGGWIAARCWGVHDEADRCEWVGAQTSPVYVTVGGRPMTPDSDALTRLDQYLVKKLAWVRTEARCTDEKHRERLAGIFESARAVLQKRLNSDGPAAA